MPILEAQPAAPLTRPPKSVASPGRFGSIDALRGLAMAIMALDHVREFFHAGAMQFSPEDLSRTTTLLFFTRWITHICAPIFFFTAGMGAYLWYRRGHTLGQLSSFLWKRGLLLALLDLTLCRVALNFSMGKGLLILNVLWALGWCMIALAVLARLPIRWLAIVSVVVIATHNLLDPITPQRFGSAAWIWNLVHAQGVFKADGVLVLAAYPLVPWIFVMSAGFCFGRLFEMQPEERQRWFGWMGTLMVALFVVVRLVNIYGDPRPWAHVPGMTALSFLRCTKYPPSLDFLLMTLGPSLVLLWWFDKLNWRPGNPLIVYGRAPLFYFIAHLYLAHLIAFPVALWRYGHTMFLFGPSPSMGGDAATYPAGYGYPLWAVYLLWFTVVAALYLPCRYFGRLKQQKKYAWLAYF